MEKDLESHFANAVKVGQNKTETEIKIIESNDNNLDSDNILKNLKDESNIKVSTEGSTNKNFERKSTSSSNSLKKVEVQLLTKEEESKRREEFFSLASDEALFCLSVDGSENTDFSFEVITKELLPSFIHSKLLIMHIYNTKLDSTFNFRFQKETVIEKFSTAVLKLGKEGYCLWEDRGKNLHPLDQVNRAAHSYKASFLVCGYSGMKGAKSDNKELSKGIDYLLGFGKVPTILVKELTLRDEKKQKGYNWLFVFDRAYIDTFNILKTFIKLVDKKLDKIYGLTLLPSYVNYDDVKNKFTFVMDEEKITNYEYNSEDYKKLASTVVNEIVNFGENIIDFLVLYNNPEKHRNEKDKSDIVNIITKSKCNICFMNSG